MPELALDHLAEAPPAVDPKALDRLLADFDSTAAVRDAAGGTAKRERDLIRDSGLLGLTVQVELGGLGGTLSDALKVTRRMAAVDSSLAHLFAFHHFQLATLQFYGPRRQWAPLHEATARNALFWGNALNPLDRTSQIIAGPEPGEHRVNGVKGFCSGASDSDMLVLSALRPDQPGLVVAAIPTTRPGITIHDDWDNMGQRQTDSGRVSFKDVLVRDSEILNEPGPMGSDFATLRSLLGQLILVHLYQGIAEGALSHAADHVDPGAPAWLGSRAALTGEDPLVLRNFGDYVVQTAASGTLTDAALGRFQAAFDLGDHVTPALRGEVAVAITIAKIAASRASLDVSSRIFEVLGARATAARLKLDRFWRNARTHTLHDPLDIKLQELGDWRLNGRAPKPSFYS